jgi:hypothetical protein
MGNLQENNYHNLKLKIDRDDYWDFFVNKDNFSPYSFSTDSIYDKCLMSYIDTSIDGCVEDNMLIGSGDYTWESAVTSDYTLENIGYTGVDNGLITFRKDRISNKDFVEIFQNSKYQINNDARLKLHAVSGNTLLYDYPLKKENDVIKLNGGFYQGFFKTECDKYYILPSALSEEMPWEFEFVLKKSDLEPESNKTLNDKYPDNKGIFFYIGTRAENKWIYYYEEEDECNTLAPDNYVEDSEISFDDYIIGNFYDLDPEFTPIPPLDIDDYLNFNYYDDSYYSGGTVIIDENLPHINMDNWCCNGENDNSDKNKKIRYDFSRCQCMSCGCIRRPPSEEIIDESKTDESISDLIFGDGYIDDYDGLDYDTDYWEPEMDISDFEYETSDGFKLKSANDYFFYTDNKFLLFDRTCNGYTVRNWEEGTKMMYYGKKDKFKGNLFILMNRTCTGYNVNTINELRDEENSKYDSLYKDIYNNAFALRITDNGELGYRLLTYDCEISGENKTSIIEGYSFPNVIENDKWYTIHVKIIPHLNTMKIYFYVNGKLVYITKDLPKVNLHDLDDLYEKQEGVPYNISLGGGTQGLSETILNNYMLNPTRTYPIEENFAGSFIGYFKSFKFYGCPMEYTDILNNAKVEEKKNEYI